MQGAGANHERVLRLYEDKVVLRADEDQPVDIEPLDGVLLKPQTVEWSGILLDRNETFSNLDLWLACNFPEYCVLSVKRSAVKSGLVGPALRWGGSAVVEDETLGYLSSRPGPAKHLVELGARAHGPTAPALAANLVGQVRAWDQEYRHGRGPIFAAHPRSTPADELPAGTHITTRHTQLTITWP
jgi:protein-L-isoaspartate(D-aspartate) O-methyltransferase